MDARVFAAAQNCHSNVAVCTATKFFGNLLQLLVCSRCVETGVQPMQQVEEEEEEGGEEECG